MSHLPSRRHVLRSAAGVVALPFLPSLGFRRFAAAAPAAAAPPAKRLVFLGFGWGVTEDLWYPDIKTPGPDYVLPPGLAPLARHKADFTIVQGLWNKYANEGHWGSTMWLTGANRYAQPGQNFHNSVSADQVAASQLGLHTRFASLQFNYSEKEGDSGHGPGLSMAWDVSGKPVGGQNGPLAAYHRLFSADNAPIEKQRTMLAEKRSVLDAVLDNAQYLQKGLNTTDQRKLDEYFEGIRDIETRLAKDEQWIGVPQPKATLTEPGQSVSGRDEIALVYDIILAALRTDSTRVITYRQPVASLLTSLDIKVHPHDMSHYHGSRNEQLDASRRRDLAQSELFAGFLDRLQAAAEPEGTTLFDHTTVVFGSNIRTGHELTNCPTLIAGRGAGVKLGHNLVVPKNTPLCNAWLTLLQGSGVEVDRHGDSTGIVESLYA
ncbi:MAG: DUF1552 domain-containing protein [Planctomycetia bacterium]|nr:DUF1552 domain-containing protein [Planctomycetia bacterium]